MRDLKTQQNKTRRVRSNRVVRIKEKKAPRKLLHAKGGANKTVGKLLRRVLRFSVTLVSFVLAVGCCGLVIQFLLDSDQFRVKSISVHGSERLTQEQVIILSEIQTGINTFDLDLDLIGRKITENPWVYRADVQRIFPDRVAIEVVERSPVAIVNLDYLYYLDQRGDIFKVLDSADNLDFPVVTGFNSENIKNDPAASQQQLQAIVGLIQNLRQRTVLNLEQISEIHQEEDGRLTVFTSENGVEIKLGWNNFAAKLDRLERIYSRLKPKLKILDYIDLNVDEKVIVRIERYKATAKG